MRMETITENFIFKKAYTKGKKQPGKFVVLYGLKHKGATRYGITVSKKLGTAVVRNRARRRLRECLRLSEPRIRQGFDLILVARSASVTVPFSLLLKAVEEQLEKGGMLCEKDTDPAC